MKVLKLIAIGLLLILAGGAFFLLRGDIPADVVDARYSNAASQFITLDNGARVHFRDQGNHEGTPLVLIHGSNASLHTFEPWVERLGDLYRIITIDMPAHGLTGAVPDGDYSSNAQLKTVHDVVAHLELTQFVMGGNSMGGGITWRYALAYPDAVSAMILIDTAVPRDWHVATQPADSKREAPLAFRLLAEPWFRAIAGSIDPYYLAKQGLESSYNYSPVVDEALIMRYVDLALREGTREATLTRFSTPRSQESVDLSRLDIPTLVLWGEEDSVIPASYAQRLGSELPRATVKVFPAVGHVPMEEIPEASARVVRTFLSGLPDEREIAP